MGQPYLPNVEALVGAGINPKTHLPYKLGGTPCTLKDDALKIFRVMDEQNAIRRYQWHNLPNGLN